MFSSMRSVLGRAVAPTALAAAAALPLVLPSQAHAWWRGGVWIGIPPVVVGPPAYYAPPAVYTPPAYSYGYGYGNDYGYGYGYPHRVWVPGHWRYGYWVPGHWG